MDSVRLTPNLTRRALGLAKLEGLCYALMVGLGETWFIPYAVTRGATASQAGLQLGVALGAGGLGSVLAMRLLRWTHRRRLLVVAGTAIQTLVLALLPWVTTLPTMMLLVGAHYAAAQLAGTAWGTWFGDVVPRSIRGRYFSQRTRAVHLLTFAAVITGGIILDRLSGNAGDGIGPTWGFSVVFGCAAMARAISTAILLGTPEPRFGGLPKTVEILGFLRSEAGRPMGRLLVIAAAFQLSVYLASPYFTPYMITEIKLGYLELTVASAVIVMLKVTALPRWGHAVDRLGARPVYLAAALMVGLIPLPWVWASNLGWVLAAQALSGLSWGGYEIGIFSLLLHGAPGRVRAPILAAHNLLVGAAQFSGTLIGQVLVADGPAGCRRAFALSSFLRVSVALIAFRVLRGPTLEARGSPSEVFLRVVGLRPHGGLAHRPVVEIPPEEDDTPNPLPEPDDLTPFDAPPPAPCKTGLR